MRGPLRDRRGLTATAAVLLTAGVAAPALADGPEGDGAYADVYSSGSEANVEAGATAPADTSDGPPPEEEGGPGPAEDVPTSTSVDDYDGPITMTDTFSGETVTVDPDDVDFRAPLAPGVVQVPNSGILSTSPDGTVDQVYTGGPGPTEETEDAPAAEPEPVDVQALAQTAVSEMTIRAPEIASTPDDPDTLGAVGLPVWFWVSDPGPETTGPNSTSATAGNVTVTATATFTGMTIDTGDGNTIECAGPGTEYPGTGIEESPDCGHIYEQMSDEEPDGLYTVAVTAHWEIQWAATTGESGTIPLDLSTDKQLRIGSYQAVTTG